jgi:hypothetical protein
MRLASCVSLLIAVALTVGCDSGPSVNTVSGKITYEGKAVTTGLINFRIAGQRPLGGPIGADGSYQFDLPAGEYQVRIDTPGAMPPGWKEGDAPAPMGPRQVPEKYADFGNGLTATVKDAGAQTIDFALPIK